MTDIICSFATSKSSESAELLELFGVKFVVEHNINGCFGNRPGIFVILDILQEREVDTKFPERLLKGVEGKQVK